MRISTGPHVQDKVLSISFVTIGELYSGAVEKLWGVERVAVLEPRLAAADGRRRAKFWSKEREDKLGVVLLGRPYHNDPGVNHEILEEFQAAATTE